MGSSGRIMLIAVVCVVFVPICRAGTENVERKAPAEKNDSLASENGTKVLHFPKGRSMGTLWLQKGRIAAQSFYMGPEVMSIKTEYLAEARGDVKVPSDKKVMLSIGADACRDLSPLTRLGPNDLYRIGFMPTEPGRINTMADDTCMPHLASLTGLKELFLEGTAITNKGMRFIKDFKSLEHLWLPSQVSNEGLNYVAQSQSLKGLYFPYFMQSEVTSAGLAHLAKLTSLEVLSISGGPRIGDAGLVHVAKLPSLRYLQLCGENFTDKGLEHVRNARSLRTLNLARLPITDAGLAYLSELPELESLDLNFVGGITDEGMSYLKKIRSLKTLNIGAARVGDKGLAHLKELKSLESLNMPGRNVTDKGLAYLSELSKLRYLNIAMPHFNDPKRYQNYYTDEGLEHLAELQALEYLSIGGIGVTDVGMSHIAKPTNLKELMLFACPITNAGLAKLTTLKSLEKLELGFTNITIAGLTALRSLPALVEINTHQKGVTEDGTILNIAGATKLETLRLTPPRLRDEDLECLANLKRLRILQIQGSISDKGMAHLAGLTSLFQLYVAGSKLSDKALSYLANMKNLSICQIRGGNFTEKGLRHLEGLKALSHLEVISDNDIGPAAKERLQAKLPLLRICTIEKNREIEQSPTVGKTAPPFRLQILDGPQIKLEDLRGKCVLLYFWATWCKPCVASMPRLKRFYKHLSRYEDFEMIGLSMDESEFAMHRFLEKYKPRWPQVHLGLRSKLSADYGVGDLAPTYVLIGPDGNILLSNERSWRKIDATVQKTLRGTGKPTVRK